MNQEQLGNGRDEAADDAFESYDFGDETVEAANGWESNNQSDLWRRVFFLADPEGGDSLRQEFAVKFKPGTAEVEEAYVA